ncbi:MAG: PspC domain-containing protein [Bryobacterales bacterium]|nr:PspC domain-containing protein [Bryobacterales bacterium]
MNPERVSPWGVPRVLSRPLWEKKIGGVCAGFARYLNVDVTLVRIVWLVTALATGIGFIAYLIAWIAMPKEPRMLLPADGGTQQARGPRQGPQRQQDPDGQQRADGQAGDSASAMKPAATNASLVL